LGVSEEQARAYSSVSDLERALVAIADKARAKEAAEPLIGVPVPEKAEVEQKIVDVLIEAGDDLDEEAAKKINAALKQVSERGDAKVAELEKALENVNSILQQNQAVQFAMQFDNMLTKHGERYTRYIGKGSTMELEEKFRVNRNKIVEEMGIIVQSHALRHKPIPSDDILVQKALREVFGEKEKDNGHAGEDTRRGQFLRRGSTRSSAGPSKRTMARMALREKLEALGD